MTTKLNTLLIGTGAIAQSMHLPNLAANPRIHLHTICDLNTQSLQATQEKYKVPHTSTDFQSAIANPDIQLVVLATTEKLRRPVIELCAKHKKPIYVEKPVAASLPEMLLIQQIVKQSGLPICVGHNRRASPAMRFAHDIFSRHMKSPRPSPWRWHREGSLPSLPEANAPGMSVRINDDWYSWKSWVFDKTQAPHGPMLFEMTHFTDICNWFMGAKPVSASAIETGMLHSGVTIRYANLGLATITMCATGTFGYTKELYEVMGLGGYLAIDHMLEVRTAGIEDAPAHTTFPLLKDRHPGIGTEAGLSGWWAKKQQACKDAAAAGDPLLQFTAEPDKGHAHMLSRFIDQITLAGPEVSGIDTAVDATLVAFAAIKSAQLKREVTLQEVLAG